MQQDSMPVPRAFQVQRIDTDTGTIVMLDELMTRVYECKWANLNGITWIEFSGFDKLRVDVHMICATYCS